MPPTCPLPPLPTTSSSSNRILHSLSTLTAPARLPTILSRLPSRPPLPLLTAFLRASLRSFRLLSPALRLLSSSLPSPPPLSLSNLLLRSLPHHPSPVPLLLFPQLLRHGLRPDRLSFPPVISSVSRGRDLFIGLSVHGLAVKCGVKDDAYVANSLLHMYSRFGLLGCAVRVFDGMPRKEVVAWSSVVDAYNTAGRYDEALFMFEKMQYAGVKPNRVTLISTLNACAARGALEMGVWINNFIQHNKLDIDVKLGTSLINMYAKCGEMKEAIRIFQAVLKHKNTYTWNAIIGGLALAKSGDLALEYFSKMEESGVIPDEVTLIQVLRACSHSGLVETGRSIFDSLVKRRYGFGPGVKHYGCMADLLGRAGLLEEAMELIEGMPFEPSVVAWGALLGGCRAHGDMRMSEVVVKKMVEIEPDNVVHYVGLCNLYDEMGRWREGEEVRRVMKEKGMRKDAGLSFGGDEDEDYDDQEAFG